jgi:hypothetical protein
MSRIASLTPTATPDAALTTTPPPFDAQVLAPGVVLRDGPGDDYARIRGFDKGERLAILGEIRKRRPVLFHLDGQTLRHGHE